MQHNKAKDSALANIMTRCTPAAFEVADDFVRDAQQYHRKQEIENKVNPYVRKPRVDAVTRANQKERDDLASRRESIAQAERQWKELFA